MAARKKTRRKPARRAKAKSAARPNKRARKGSSKRRAKKKPAKPTRAQSPQKRTTLAAPTPRAQTHAAKPSLATAPAAPSPSRGFAQSLALLASEAVRVGVVAHWFSRGGVAQLTLEAPLEAGERLHVRGATSDFLAIATSLRVNRAGVARAEPGAASLALPQRARPGDVVYALRAPA
ncbi:MAG: hypothetical protein FJ091_04980 [Deltaproteobacteria bacterium]|nr:hypothetical protein [Deltaproteobacteria bacterium]